MKWPRPQPKQRGVSLLLSTMSTRSTVILCQKLRNLQLREDSIAITFHKSSSQHIPAFKMAQKWPHLEQLANKIPPPLDCEVGYSCQQARIPREILSEEENHPFAQCLHSLAQERSTPCAQKTQVTDNQGSQILFHRSHSRWQPSFSM